MAEHALPNPAPMVTSETRPFWEGTGRGELLLPRCDACHTLFWYPRGFCPACGSFSISWQKASGRGQVYSFTVNRRGVADHPDYREAGVYVLAYVQLEEGPRIMTNIVECDPDRVAVGQPVQVVFHDTGQGTALPRFRPA
ncbi:MAG: Zn-ribbon domain-containing OB-fold protein [Chloroflexota bacterium]